VKLTIITIGKFKSSAVAELVADYAKRIGHYVSFEHMVVKSELKVATLIDSDTHLVICDEKGEEKGSKELAELISKKQDSGVKKVSILIGDAPGISDELKERANLHLSLSKMTLPHELAAVILFEQVYRAFTILKNEKYHYE